MDAVLDCYVVHESLSAPNEAHGRAFVMLFVRAHVRAVTRSDYRGIESAAGRLQVD